MTLRNHVADALRAVADRLTRPRPTRSTLAPLDDAPTGKISREELVRYFGPLLPVEALDLLTGPAADQRSLTETRLSLWQLAARQAEYCVRDGAEYLVTHGGITRLVRAEGTRLRLPPDATFELLTTRIARDLANHQI